MNPVSLVKDIIQQTVDDKINKEPFGIVLKRSLGLKNIDKVYIQKVIGISMGIYVVSYNSRYPWLHIPRSRLKKVQTMMLQRVNKRYPKEITFKKMILSPPVELDTFISTIPSNAIIITQDICGDRFQQKNLLEF